MDEKQSKIKMQNDQVQTNDALFFNDKNDEESVAENSTTDFFTSLSAGKANKDNKNKENKKALKQNKLKPTKEKQLKTDKKKLKKQKGKSLDVRFDEDAQEAEEIAKNYKDDIAPTDVGRIIHAEKEVKKKSSRFMVYFYAICLIVNIVSFAVILYIIGGSDKASLVELLKKPAANGWWLIAAILCFVLGMFIESLRFQILILKSTKKNRPYISYKTTAIGRFYDLITPLSTGGQPFQISYLNKHGIGSATASSVPVAKYIFAQFTYLIAIVLLLVFGGVVFEGNSIISGFVSITAYLGLAVQFVILVVVILLSNSKKIGPAIVISLFKLANKMHLIKDYKEAYVKVLKFCYEYQTAMRSFISNFPTFISMLFSSVCVYFLRVSIPFCIYCAFFGFDPSMWMSTVARIMLCELAMGVWILPGNVIFADIAFLALFKTVFTGGTLFWALLFWRILSYYCYIVQGFGVKIYDKIKYGWFKAPVIMHNDIPDVGKKKKKRKTETTDSFADTLADKKVEENISNDKLKPKNKIKVQETFNSKTNTKNLDLSKDETFDEIIPTETIEENVPIDLSIKDEKELGKILPVFSETDEKDTPKKRNDKNN